MSSSPTRRDTAAGVLLGVALGGFFDGILLHQILQWHHLLSALEETDVRFQVAADGYFHALMYVLAAIGLWLLWRGRARIGAGRLSAWLLIGFGLWHVLDSILSHWLLGIHRIRMDSDTPLFWDILWLVVFGLVPLIAGWMLRRRGGAPPRAPAATVLGALAIMVSAGLFAARPAPDSPFATVLFGPGVDAASAFRAVAAKGGRIVWTDASGQLIVYAPAQGSNAVELFGEGAILVGGSGLPAGCFGWSRA